MPLEEVVVIPALLRPLDLSVHLMDWCVRSRSMTMRTTIPTGKQCGVQILAPESGGHGWALMPCP